MPATANATPEFFDALRFLLGPEHLIAEDVRIQLLACDTLHENQLPCAFAYPADAGQLQELVRLATLHQVPIWAASRGNNWGYGGSTPCQPGSLMVILERMNRILEVNVDLAYVVIEPGVTYEQLNRYLREHKIPLWADCTDGTPQGSVIGNALERGVGETPYGDHFGNLCGLEVVLPDGSMITTGGGSPEQPLKTWNVHKWGSGPYVEGLFSQSNLGIVTRAGMWLMPEPEAFESYVFECREPRYLPEVLNAFRRLALQGIVRTKLHVINEIVSLAVLTQKRDEPVAPGSRMSEQEIRQLCDKYKVSAWSGGGGLYGSAAEIRVQKRIMVKALGAYGRLLFFGDRQSRMIGWLAQKAKTQPVLDWVVRKLLKSTPTALESISYLHQILKGEPTDYFLKHAYFKNPLPRPKRSPHPAKDRCGLIWFAPILPLDGAEVTAYLGACADAYRRHGFDFYVAMMMLSPRSVVPLMGLMFEREHEAKQAGALHDELLQIMHRNHYQQYRAGVHTTADFAAHPPSQLAMCQHLKDRLDPQHILSPGKYGLR